MSEVAEELRAMRGASQDSGGLAAGLVGTLADQVERGASRLSAGDLDQVLEDTKRFARNQPGTFLLGALGAGFLVGRLLRAADLKQVGEAAKSSATGQDGPSMGTNGQAPLPAGPSPAPDATVPPTAPSTGEVGP